jgi:hypothetical protein
MARLWVLRCRRVVDRLDGVEQREEPETRATDEERARAREEFRRKLAAAEARMTPEKRDRVRAAFGLDSRAA